MKRAAPSHVLIVDGVKMRSLKKLPAFVIFILLFLAACSTPSETSVTPTAVTTTPPPTATQTLPTASSPGNSILWAKLQVTMLQREITADYLTEYGSTRLPPPGQKFLWVHVQIKNMDQA